MTKEEPKSRMVSARFPAHIAQDLSAFAQSRGVTMTRILIEGTKRRLDELKQEEAGTLQRGNRPPLQNNQVPA